MQRIRLVYSKGDELKYTGNLDMHKVWERSFRRAGLPLAYSQGFHPQPKIHQACPLPLGFTSEEDLLDFWLDSDLTQPDLREKLEKALQPGITILEIQFVPSEEKPLQTQVISATYEVVIDDEHRPADLEERLDSLLNKKTCVRERRGKQYDLLPLIESLKIDERNLNILEMTLAARPSATGRPEEVLDALGIALQDATISRKKLLLVK